MFTFLLKDISDYYCSESEKKGQQRTRRKEERASTPPTDNNQEMRSANPVDTEIKCKSGKFLYRKFCI